VIGSLVCTLAFEPFLSILRRVSPPSSLQELSKPAFLLNDALVDPSLALELAAREEARVIERLPTMLDDIRADATTPAIDPQTLIAASHAISGVLAGYLDAILWATPAGRDRERLIRLQHHTANVDALFDSLGEFRAATQDCSQWPSSTSVADNMVEGVHALLLARVDVAKSQSAEDRSLLLSMLGSRDELMERMRQRLLRTHPDMPTKAQDGLFAATMLFERIVWLIRRSAMLMAPPQGANTNGYAE